MMKHTPSSQYFGTRRKEKLRRILTPVLLVISILAVTLMLGNLLKDRLTAAEALLSLPAASYPEKDTTVKTPAQLLLHKDKNIPDVHYSAWEIDAAGTDYDGLAANYGGISTAVPAEMTDTLAERLRPITQSVTARGMQACAVIPITNVIGADTSTTLSTVEKLVQDLDALAFTEILFTGITGEESIAILAELPGTVHRTAEDMHIGFAFTAAAFESGPFAPALEVLAEAADFLALDPGSVTDAEDAVELAFRHRGSIEYFALRILIRGDKEDRLKTETALQVEGYTSLQSVPKLVQ